MKRLGGNKGFSAVEIVLVIVVIGLIAAAAYVLYSRQNSGQTSTEPATASDVQAAPEQINDTNDLNAAEDALDANDPALSESDASQLDAELSEL